MKIADVKPGVGISIRGVIKKIQPVRKTWKCFNCKNEGRWEDSKDFKDNCPKCDAFESKEYNKGVWMQLVTSALVEDESGSVYVDLWKEDIERFKEGDTLEISNGFCKSGNTGKLNVGKGKHGSLLLVIDERKDPTPIPCGNCKRTCKAEVCCLNKDENQNSCGCPGTEEPKEVTEDGNEKD